MEPLMLHKRFVLRQLTRSWRQCAVFVMCVGLSILVLTAINGFKASVNQAMLSDARRLHAADIIIHSHYPLSAGLGEKIDRLQATGSIQAARIYEFYSVVRNLADTRSLLTKLKVVEPGYPFYGQVVLQSGRAFEKVLEPGRIVVEAILLDRLNLKKGDALQVGAARLTIEDVLISEPDRPVSIFSLGPRIFISAADLSALDLIGKGSRSSYDCLIRVMDPKDLNPIAKELQQAADPVAERVDTFRTARSGVKRFFDNFLFFLSLTGIFTLFLAGFGIQSALSAFLKEKEYTIAIMKTVGAPQRFILFHYLLAVALLAAAGTGLGIAAGYGLQAFLPRLFAGLLPAGIVPVFSWPAVVQGALLGSVVVGLFTYLPLYRLREIRPTAIFKQEPREVPRGPAYYGAALLIGVFFAVTVLWQLDDLTFGLYFLLAVFALILCVAGITQAMLAGLKKIRIRPLSLRQALKGLFRPKNATRLITITLAASLSVIVSIYLVEKNLDATFIESYPPDAPNIFFLDIQPSQVNDFAKLLNRPVRLYPIIRARVVGVNQEKIDPAAERRKKGDNLGREFNLTYREDILSDEKIVEGRNLFRADWPEPQVSVMDTVLEMHPMQIGDHIRFNIQGIPLEARISSVRTRTRESLSPFFYFVFPPGLLKNAPQTIFSAVRVEPEKIADLQNLMAARFPNLSIIDVTDSIAVFGKVMQKLSHIVRFFALFSCAAGILILVSSLLATRSARIREAVYFKILGARSRFILRVLGWENLLLGMMSAGLAAVIGQIGSFIICWFVLDIGYQPFISTALAMIAITLVVILSIGLIASRQVLRQKPVVFLREFDGE
jgi:putative ABC transport system permease protein